MWKSIGVQTLCTAFWLVGKPSALVYLACITGVIRAEGEWKLARFL